MVRCMRCGRELKNEKAIERGYGCGCYAKLAQTSKNQSKLADFWQ